MTTYGCLLPTRGVTIASETPGELTKRTRSDVVGLARRAEREGFDSVWVGDRVVDKHRPEALVTLAAVAGATDSVGLGTAIFLPVLRHPVHVAHQTATIQHVSGGRLSLGIGAGAPDLEYELTRLGIPFEHRGARLDESLDVVRALWTGESVTYDGAYYDLDDVSIGIEPPTTPPIYVATTAYHPEKGFPRAIANRLTAHGDGWLPLGMSPTAYEQALETARDGLRDAGRDPTALDPALYQDVVVADTEREALDEAREFLLTYYGERWDDLSDDELRARGAFGPPAVVADHLERYREAGVETFVTRFATTDQHEQVSRFADLLE